MKQTFGRRKLRSHSAENARVELEWSLAGLWAIGLYAAKELVLQGIPLARLSISRALAAFRQLARDYLHPRDPQRTLKHLLRQALQDTYQRKDKSSRDYPRKKNERPAGAPAIHSANNKQRSLVRKMKTQQKYG